MVKLVVLNSRKQKLKKNKTVWIKTIFENLKSNICCFMKRVEKNGAETAKILASFELKNASFELQISAQNMKFMKLFFD